MEGVVVRLLVVFSGMVRVAWAPTPLGEETPQITYRAGISLWIKEAFLDNSGFLRRFPEWVFMDEG
ncbi:Bgt-55029 [Blumeria graminis f. sp. tritici]|uniref:Bgt-55029 n=1 Tax=Blumeria graminis f. sp. tritici TaxID=62690 RepID=A0A9X9LAN4_BLUGR|nr:Bgt-55029 [Blumeria graminis f. sp. tritici]